MALKKGAERPAILLDWFNVSYRSIVLGSIGLMTVAVVVGGGLYYRYIYRSSPKYRASTAITAAEGLLDQAASGAGTEQGVALKQSSQRLLGDARRQFDATNYEDATKSAEQSQMSSQRLLALSRGEAGRAAQFYKIEGDVRVKRARELIWQPVTKGMTLSVGDQIKTNSRSAAQIIYFNGTITTVTPGSLLEIKELYENPSTRVQQVRERLREGRIAATTQEPNTKGSFHEIATQNTVATTEARTSLDVAFDDGTERTRLEVHTGAAKVSVGEGASPVAVEAQERVEVDRDARLSDKVKLPPAPVLDAPIDQKVIPLVGAEDTSVSMTWQEIPEATRYRLTVSSRSLFSDTLVDQNFEANSATLPHAREGNYYWRVAAVFEDGTEGPSSEIRKFKVVPGNLTISGDDEPPSLSIDDFLVFATQVIVRGKTEPGALLSVNGVKIDVYDDGTFTSVIALRKMGRNALVFTAQDIAGNATRLQRMAEVDTY
jgi:hypothetical protein